MMTLSDLLVTLIESDTIQKRPAGHTISPFSVKSVKYRFLGRTPAKKNREQPASQTALH